MKNILIIPALVAIVGFVLAGVPSTAQAQTTIAPVSIGTMAVSGSSMTITLPALSVTTIDVH